MKPKLYILRASPSVRAVLITIKYLGIDVECIEMNFLKGDLKNPEFLKLNPQHTTPTLVDDNRPIWDSHAINVYLVSKYGKNDDLYPKDIYNRAIVDQRMHFEGSCLYSVLRHIDLGLLYKWFKQIPKYLVEEVKQNYEFLEKFLDGNRWSAGECLTLADFSLMTTVTSLDVHIPIDKDTFPNISTWLKDVAALPCCADDAENLTIFKQFVDYLHSQLKT